MPVGVPSACSILNGLDILLVEDEAIVSLMVEDLLAELGCSRVWHAGRISEALRLVDEQKPGAAVLDINVGGEPVFAVAERLEARGTPFVFTTGYEPETVPLRWRDRPFLQKPIDFNGLAKALGRALAR